MGHKIESGCGIGMRSFQLVGCRLVFKLIAGYGLVFKLIEGCGISTTEN